MDSSTAETREVWLRGPLPDIPPLLQPIAHALMQAREEVVTLMRNFPEEKLWERPAGVASVGFHLQHLTGVLDRLFTYARGEALSLEQITSLAGEGKEDQTTNTAQELVRRFDTQVDKAITQLRMTAELTLTEVRGVGRASIPSTVIGLLTHSAEHTMRHIGQLSVTVRVITF
ncbi:DinB family protein [Spirosoma luteum]|uniref:DinB family protein n=1 Tax=Spirosoma luteum TaxID=431553 RepID=UPI000362EDB6|nr:DinB family protein [Spirosoma luteum]